MKTILPTNSFVNRKYFQKRAFSLYLIIFMFLYALFALDRIKGIFSFHVEGITTTNELWLIPLLCILIYIIEGYYDRLHIDKYNSLILFSIFMYVFIIILGGFNIVSISQYLYAGSLFIIPILIFFTVSRCNIDCLSFLIKFFVITNFLYSIFAILLTNNYAFFMELVDNYVDYRYYSQYRPSMMLGSSITVGYYFNLTLPLCLYVFNNIKGKKWKIFSVFAIVSNIIASFVLLSRVVVLCSILILLIYFLLVRSSNKKIRGKIVFIFSVIGALIYAFDNFDLSRIFKNLSFSDTSSISRFEAGSIGLYIFSKYPILGSGVGRYFERAYTNRYINIDGTTGLIDPHNMYILILSEMGILGILVTIFLLIALFKSFSYIREKTLRQTAYITLLAFLFDSLGGSDLFNNISFATIFWIYMGFFNAISRRDRNNKCCGNGENIQ